MILSNGITLIVLECVQVTTTAETGKVNMRRVLYKHVFSVLETAYQKLSEPAAKGTIMADGLG